MEEGNLQERTVELDPHPMRLHDLLDLPTNDDTWHALIIRWDDKRFSLFPWEVPSVHLVGSLANGDYVVVVTSCIYQRFHNAYRQYILRQVETGQDVFFEILKPNNGKIAEYGLEAAERKTRSDVLRRAVQGVTSPGGLALYRYYKEIIHDNSDILPLEWALLGYDLRLSGSEVRDKFVLSSLLLDLHFVQDLESHDVSQLVERKRQDGWGSYLLMKESLAISKVVENADEEMHELLLVRGLLEFAGHKTSVRFYQHDQECATYDSCIILGRALRRVFEPKQESKFESSGSMPARMEIPRLLGAYEVQERLNRSGYSEIDISQMCANLAVFLPIGIPVPYHETLPATLVNRLKRKVVMNAIRAISDTCILHLPALLRKEHHARSFLLYLVRNGLETEVTKTWMNSTEGQSIYDQTLASMREQAQSLEEFILCLNTLIAYLHLLDPPEPAVSLVYACHLCDFSYLLHGGTQINRRSVLEAVAGSVQKVLAGFPADIAQILMPMNRPPPVQWCDGIIQWYLQRRAAEVMTHDEA
ncbi:uncharacterized protein FMAN_14133 [Fusarium mangiferae]|uniref:Uncharacterized protein n=1 Tax=Fusarium mangiferae TaxID=192010 RepID=A0A1L7UC23_FUSMA|nr:uncharacterized protein FMAN_14133 [Fusarium mangiferae]CVL08250.1 uncharacterized protein FMAN_14133 [Fusarium mangiferae]